MNFKKELDSFDFFTIDNNFINTINETSLVFDSFNTLIKRINIEQSKTNSGMEEILTILDEEQEKRKEEDETIKCLETIKADMNTMVIGFIDVLDLMEELYRYSRRSDGGQWENQLELLWDISARKLLSFGLVRIEGAESLFDQRLHIAKEVKNINDRPDGIVLEILKSGYMYKSMIIRKAEVVVNLIKRGCEDNGDNGRD